jgi:membrane-associated protease RseP (regulator of RpoE activity)
MPLLFEKGYDSLCRSVWCVYLPLPLQLERLMARDHLTREEAMSRIRTVMSSDEKAARSNVVIDNSGTVEETLSQIPSLLQAERNAAKAVPRRRRSDRWQQADEGSPAEEAGLKSGMIMTAFDGEKIETMADLQEELEYYAAGETVDVTVQKADENGEIQEMVLPVTLGRRSDYIRSN